MENPWYFVVAICAVIGAGLGFLNFYRSYLADHERVRVVQWHGSGDGMPRIEVVNVSIFPVTVVEVKCVTKSGEIVDIVIEVRGAKPVLPHRIEARDSYSFH